MQNTNTTEISKKIEALLFYAGEPLSIDYLAKLLEVKKDEVVEGLKSLQESIQNRGIFLIEHNGEVTLVTSPEVSDVVEKMVQDEHSRDLGKASMETLSIVAYKGPVSRKEIEYIRGVNSQFALRNLLLRGLVERKNKEGDERVVLYTVTLDTLMHLGLEKISDLPEYANIIPKLEAEEIKEEETDGE